MARCCGQWLRQDGTRRRRQLLAQSWREGERLAEGRGSRQNALDIGQSNTSRGPVLGQMSSDTEFPGQFGRVGGVLRWRQEADGATIVHHGPKHAATLLHLLRHGLLLFLGPLIVGVGQACD